MSSDGEGKERDRATMLMGTIAFQKNKAKIAKRTFQKVEDPVFEKETAYAYGATFLESEEYASALKGLRANIKLKGPNRVLTLYKIGVSYFKLGQYSRAEKYFLRTNSKTLPAGLGLERQRYITEIRQRHEELLSAFMNVESEVRTLDSASRDSSNLLNEDELDKAPKPEGNWSLRFKPNAMLRQESDQNLNRGAGRDVSDIITHRVGLRTYAGGDSSGKAFGSVDFGLGFAGYDVTTQRSQQFNLPNVTGTFLSRSKDDQSEDTVYLNLQPMFNVELTPALRAELGMSYGSFLPHSKFSEAWGQSEVFTRVRAEGKTLDGGLEVAIQKPNDQSIKATANDALVKGDINQRLGDFNLRANAQGWRTDNTAFRSFDRNRMTMVDNRYKYHLGFKTETKFGVSGSMSFGDVAVRASYDFTARASGHDIIERLSSIDDPETTARQVDKRMFAIGFPIWDTVNISLAAGTQNLGGYHYISRDTTTSAITRVYETGIKQNLLQLGVAVAVVDWIKIRLNYSVGDYAYVSHFAKDPAFRNANPKGSETSVMHIELNKSF